MLDDMEVYFNGQGSKFDDKFYGKLLTCLGKYEDDILVQSQDFAWKGLRDYYFTNGTDADYLGRSDHWNEEKPGTGNVVWAEAYQNKPKYFGDVLIYEPCDYASNVAYYHSVMRLCDYPDWTVSDEYRKAIKRAFATLTTGSAAFHGSQTRMGDSYDNNMIAVIAYLGHQLSVSKFNSTSSILNELSPTPRGLSSLEISEQITQTIITQEPKRWSQFLEEVDYPRDYMITFAALVGTCTSLLLPTWINTPLITLLANALIPKESADFIIESYLPELALNSGK